MTDQEMQRLAELTARKVFEYESATAFYVFVACAALVCSATLFDFIRERKGYKK